MSELSDHEIRDIATESGLSTNQVRRSLDGSKALVKRAPTGMVAPSVRGSSAAFAEARLSEAPDQAVQRVKLAIERDARSKGHMQGGGEADIIDEQRDLTYRVRAESDESGGALVRVDIDPGRATAKRTMAAWGVGLTTAAVGALALLFGSVSMSIGAAVIGVAGFLGVGAHRRLEQARIQDAHGLVSQALSQAESRSPAALPSAD
jgi:hypothetical protein